tara:strand:+ start:2480 stop:2767 length:288 start_codon:yes stop_codon:yes gene_type:complete
MTKRNVAYFGYLKDRELNGFSPKQKLDHYVSKKLFVAKKVLKLPSNTRVDLSDASIYRTILEPSKELLEAYYSFLAHTYREYLNNVFIDFFPSVQ